MKLPRLFYCGLMLAALASPANAFHFLWWGKSKGEAPKKKTDRRAELGVKSLEVLKSGLSDKDADVRVLAAKKWGELGNRAAVPLLKNALTDDNSFVRVAAAASLYRLGDDSGMPALERIAKQKPLAAASQNPLEEMRRIARNKIRIEAIRAIGTADSKAAVPLLLELEKDAEPAIQEASAVYLARLGYETDIGTFVQALESQDEEERLAAARNLATIGVLGIYNYLKPAVKDSSDRVRQAAVQGLGEIADPVVLPDLERALADESKLVRAKAVEAIGKVKSPGAAALLKDALERAPNAYVQLLAMAGLGRQGEQVDSAVAQRALSQPDVDTRLLAVDVLEQVGGDKAVEELQFALEDQTAAVRVKAAAALVRLLQKRQPA